VKVLTLALGAVVATSALVYLSAGGGDEEVDLVAPKVVRSVPLEAPIPGSSTTGTGPSVDSQQIPVLPEVISKERDRSASLAKTNLFRVLETPAPPQVAAVSSAVVEAVPVVTPKPSFVFIGSFKEGAELQAIVQVGEAIEFVKPNQIVAGFRVDSIDSAALRWTHEQSATKGLLQARGVR
jgi:hypothetical protein